ncbi:hypothetical protein ACFXTN_043227 [Malus domestica]|uniref:Uncharacterized protein n=1 Tax=Malus domestica TaxID=3750 RepID=A0A498J9F9_MALDO|nr:hypothetical protein DVH24_035528 [Malus domestica]
MRSLDSGITVSCIFSDTKQNPVENGFQKHQKTKNHKAREKRKSIRGFFCLRKYHESRNRLSLRNAPPAPPEDQGDDPEVLLDNSKQRRKKMSEDDDDDDDSAGGADSPTSVSSSQGEDVVNRKCKRCWKFGHNEQTCRELVAIPQTT